MSNFKCQNTEQLNQKEESVEPAALNLLRQIIILNLSHLREQHDKA